MTLFNSNIVNLLPHTSYRVHKGLFQLVNKKHTRFLLCLNELSSFDIKILNVGILRMIDDSMLTDFPLEFSPGLIVSAALSLACEGKGWPCSKLLCLFGNLLTKKPELSSEFKFVFKFKASNLYNVLIIITRMLRLNHLRLLRMGLGKMMNLKKKFK